MKNLRPFAWVIIALNAYFFISFFIGIDGTESDTVVGLGFMILIFWLAIMNTFLYVLYRITGGKKRDCPACGVGVKKGLTACPSCNYDFMKAAVGEPQEDIKKKVVQSESNQLLKKFNDLHDVAQMGVILLIAAVVIYGGSWFLSPYIQDADYINCGIDRLLNIECNYRYNG
jgi:hypothetical protein